MSISIKMLIIACVTDEFDVLLRKLILSPAFIVIGLLKIVCFDHSLAGFVIFTSPLSTPFRTNPTITSDACRLPAQAQMLPRTILPSTGLGQPYCLLFSLPLPKLHWRTFLFRGPFSSAQTVMYCFVLKLLSCVLVAKSL